MRKLWITFLKDMKLSFNGLYFYIEAGMMVVFILIMLFVVPETFDHSQNYHVYLRGGPAEQQLMAEMLDGIDGSVQRHESRKSLEDAMSRDRSSIGVELSIGQEGLDYEFVLQGYESERMKSLLQNMIEGELLAQFSGAAAVEQRVLEPDSERLSDRQHVLPVYLTMNVGLMGLFIIAAYIFLDKDEGVIKAYAVAPVQIWQYLASKLMIMTVIGLGTSLLTVLAIVGMQVNYPLLILAVFAFNLFGSSVGLFISSFFDSMVKAMGALYLAVMIMMIASISYFMPSFNPLWMQFMPSYPMLFSFRELLLANGDVAYVLRNSLMFLLLSAVFFSMATARFKKTLTV
ncbi:ABC transporter permease [Spirochaeta dissipatitropha]